MTRTFAMTLKRPHETLGIPMPVGRKLSVLGKQAWLVGFCVAILTSAGVYIYQVNRVTTRAYELRSLEQQAEHLRERVSSLEVQAAHLQTMRSLEERVKSLGYIPVQRPEFLEGARGTYALAK